MDFKIRKNRTAQGPKKLRAEREEYFRLVRQGYSNREASRQVGVNERTGREWRNGRMDPSRFRPPAHGERAAVATESGRYLCEAERLHIADRVREKASLRQIARELGRSPSTISREIRRNRTHVRGSQWVYRPYAAQARAEARRPRPKSRKVAQNAELRDFIQQHLDRRWSPEQICQALRKDFPERPELHVVHETVYQALYVQGRGELRRKVARALRSGRIRRQPHRQAARRRSRFTHPMVMISERPAEVEDRAVPGHWEGDLIVGKDGGSAIGTLVERSTRYVMLVHLPHGRSAERMRDALITTVKTLPAHLTRSLTWDQGSEMGSHGAFTVATGIPVYFCDPASPWQRGNTSPRAPTCPFTPVSTWTPSPPNSTPDHERRSAGIPPPSVSLDHSPPTA
ncbi:hypothetical protein GCM10009733_095060 [Nonomuraea maheshkhaliensis]|uniref:Integrase catalytic domain-containing protein n=1 Tax=Nonomuraea maheshkhaliensis TaxID=419590 RepID=A0ABN2H8S3_9ACTN